MRALTIATLLLVAAPCPAPAAAPRPAPIRCDAGPTVTVVGGHRIHQRRGGPAIFRAGLSIDADGAPNAYHPDGRGLDALANAGRPGRWWGVATDTGKRDGRPVVQGPRAPYPGYYVSTTSLQDPRHPRTDPARYVDAARIRFVVLPASRRLLRRLGVRVGDVAMVRARGPRGWRQVAAIVADLGPKDHLGEGSIALARALGLPANPRRGGAAAGVTYVVFPGTGTGRPLPAAEIGKRADAALRRWGGARRLAACSRARL